MTTRTWTWPSPSPSPSPSSQTKARLLRLRPSVLVNLVGPIVAYVVIRPFVETDAVALALTGAVPISYSLGVLLVRRRVDLVAVTATVGLALGCLVSVLLGGSSLPLKLHDAIVTFCTGLVLLGGVVIRRPVPLGRILGLPASPQLDARLGTSIGTFLVLHALLRLTLAMTLPTDTFLVTSRVVGWGSLACAAFFLSRYLRRHRHRHQLPHPLPHREESPSG